MAAKKDSSLTHEGCSKDDGTMSTITATDNRFGVAVGCGPMFTTRTGKRRRLRIRKALRKTVFWRRRNKYFDAEVGEKDIWGDEDLESQESSFCYYYFDAQETPVTDDDVFLDLGEPSLRPVKKKGAAPDLDETSVSTPRKKTSAPLEAGVLTPETATFEQIVQELMHPTNKTPKTGRPGYPGGFTPEQLEQCVSEMLLVGAGLERV
jgi:hypothetical protein